MSVGLDLAGPSCRFEVAGSGKQSHAQTLECNEAFPISDRCAACAAFGLPGEQLVAPFSGVLEQLLAVVCCCCGPFGVVNKNNSVLTEADKHISVSAHFFNTKGPA
jgi:hypothetical protein